MPDVNPDRQSDHALCPCGATALFETDVFERKLPPPRWASVSMYTLPIRGALLCPDCLVAVQEIFDGHRRSKPKVIDAGTKAPADLEPVIAKTARVIGPE